MDHEDQALADDQQTRRQLEEEADALIRIRRQAEQITNDTYSEMQRQVQRFGETYEPMEWARRELSRLEEAFFFRIRQRETHPFVKRRRSGTSLSKKTSGTNETVKGVKLRGRSN